MKLDSLLIPDMDRPAQFLEITTLILRSRTKPRSTFEDDNYRRVRTSPAAATGSPSTRLPGLRWREGAPWAVARAEAVVHAQQLASRHDDLTAAATLLLQLGHADAAEIRLLAEPGRIDGNHYGSLVPLAKASRAHECPRGETFVYRALLKGILDRAYARAYGHAARYRPRLSEIAGSGISLLPLPSHEDFEAEIRARHGRKAAFWA
jgi:hypothetical protein